MLKRTCLDNPALVPSDRYMWSFCLRVKTVHYLLASFLPTSTVAQHLLLLPVSWSPAGLVKKASPVLFLFSSLHLHHLLFSPPHHHTSTIPHLSPETLLVVDPHPPYHQGPSPPRHLRPFDFYGSDNLSAATTVDRPCLSSAGRGGDLTSQDDAAAAPTQR